ncbi:MAG: TetR/AcrR family transcriptional regulator C-terminal domain-containing protein [Roseburia sp.]
MNHTQAAIKDAFWQLLEEKPYNKITVKDIVERCQVNRNTFYYHFHDIPALLECIIKERSDYIIQTYSKFGSPIECITPIIQYFTEHKKAVLHIYNSVQKEFFLMDLEKIATYIVTDYVSTVTADFSIPDTDKLLLTRFYKCTLVGVTLDWLDQGMSYDLSAAAIHICDLLEGSGKRAFLKNAL